MNSAANDERVLQRVVFATSNERVLQRATRELCDTGEFCNE